MSMELVASSQHQLRSPAFDTDGHLFLTCSTTGALLTVNGLEIEPFLETQGSICGLAFDPSSGDAFLCDPDRQAVLKVEKDAAGESAATDFIHQFEGRALVGPQRVCFAPNGELLFTDGGAMGESSLSHPTGAVYRTVQRRQQLLRLAGSLAGPSGIAVNAANGVVYVCETACNRIIRFVPRPDGHFLSSVWVQLQGSLGPVDVAVHPSTGDVYVAKYDVEEVSSRGTIVVFSADGEEKGQISVPSPQITGVAINPDGTSIVIAVCSDATDSASRLYRCPIGQ